MKFKLEKNSRIIIKIGSAILVENGKIRKTWLRNLAKNIAALIKEGHEIAIVSSGSIALGREFLNQQNQNLSIEEKQAAATIGQIKLMSFYSDIFAKLEISVAQILLSLDDCNKRSRYLNCQNTIETLFQNKVIPIINENDSVAIDEIKIGDNDRLAARVSQMISANLLILFSDIDGLYNKNPKNNKNAKLISEVFEINKEIEKMADGKTSNLGSGGMVTKIAAAKMLKNSGCDTLITSGIEDGALNDLLKGKKNYTIFYGGKNNKKSRKKWLSGLLNAKGTVIINNQAKEAFAKQKMSLLPIGVIDLEGDFARNDVIFIKDENNNHIATGISNYNAKDVKKIFEKKSSEVKKTLGKNFYKKELVHIDNLSLI